MLASLEQESAIIERYITFRDLPLDCVRFSFPWGEAGTPLATISEPAVWEVEELGRLQDHLCARRRFLDDDLRPPHLPYRAGWSSGRGLYKTSLLAKIAHWHVSSHFGGQVILAANSESQLRARIFPEFAMWFGAAVNAHWWNVEGAKITPQAWLIDPMKRLPESGGLGLDPQFWGVIGALWSEENPSGFAGGRSRYGTLVAFDEASGIVDDIWDVTDGFFAPDMDYKLWFAASQMRSSKGRFHDIFYVPQHAKGWHTRTLSAEIMPAQAAWAKEFIARWGYDHDKTRVEVRGLPPRTDENQFISRESVTLAQTNELVRDDLEPLIFGVDPAPRGRTAIRARRGRNARDAVGRAGWVLEGYDNEQIARFVMDLENKYHPDAWVIDFGMGTGVIDALKHRAQHIYRKLTQVKFGDMPPKHEMAAAEFGSMGAYLWGLARDWLPGAMIEKGGGDEKHSLANQLLNRGWKWSGREDGKKVLESKEDLKSRGVESPDDADALALTLAIRPPRRDRGGGVRMAKRVEGVEESPYGW